MTILNFMDISSAHLRDADVPLLDAGGLPISSMSYEFGYIVSTAPLIEASTREDQVMKLREHGLSEQFIGAARKAAENGCWLLRFEMDADIDDHLQVGRFVDNPEEDDREEEEDQDLRC